jgi:hypothetical protein
MIEGHASRQYHCQAESLEFLLHGIWKVAGEKKKYLNYLDA